MSAWRIIEGDCRDVLATLPERSVHTVVTSPPYFGLRDYGTGEWTGGDDACEHAGIGRASDGVRWDGTLDGAGDRPRPVGAPHRGGTHQPNSCRCGAARVDRQIGLEPTPEEFVAALVAVFREVRRVLRDDGTVWLNLGDTYATRWSSIRTDGGRAGLGPGDDRARCGAPPAGFKSKDLIGVPWMTAFALRADGWYLRSEVIWAKPNPMPESVTDRPTKAHEQVFLLSKNARYFYDADAIREDDLGTDHPRTILSGQPSLEPSNGLAPPNVGLRKAEGRNGAGRNRRSVWTVATQPYAGAHFATFPPKLIEPCILAGCPEGGTVLDPFAGAGTTGMVARRHGRAFVGVELSPKYAAMARGRIATDERLGFRSPQRGPQQPDAQASIFDTDAAA